MTEQEAYRHLNDFIQQHPSIVFIRCQWVDYSGLLRYRIVSLQHAVHLAQTGQPISTGAGHMETILDSSLLPEYQPADTDAFYPDWTSIRMLGPMCSVGDVSYAAVMCFFARESRAMGEATSTDLCPRKALARTIEAVKQEFGLACLVGFEIELIITRHRGEQMIADKDRLFDYLPGLSCAIACQSEEFEAVEQAVVQLLKCGIQIQTFHAEGKFGQFEIALSPLPPVEAADQLTMAKDIIKTVAARNGWTATMHPRPFSKIAPNGQHMHISIEPSDREQAFLAGLLNRLPALCAISMPTTDSYSRIEAQLAGRYVAWGTQNRDVPIRKICPGRWEIRAMDTTANPYLALSAFISAGILGIRECRAPRELDCRQQVDRLSVQEMKELNIDVLMPTSVQESLRYLRNDSALAEMIGSEMIRKFVRVKERELEVVEKYSPEEWRQMMVLRF